MASFDTIRKIQELRRAKMEKEAREQNMLQSMLDEEAKTDFECKLQGCSCRARPFDKSIFSHYKKASPDPMVATGEIPLIRCVEDNGSIEGCKKCVFNSYEPCTVPCMSGERKDGKSVHFELVEE